MSVCVSVCALEPAADSEARGGDWLSWPLSNGSDTSRVCAGGRGAACVRVSFCTSSAGGSGSDAGMIRTARLRGRW